MHQRTTPDHPLQIPTATRRYTADTGPDQTLDEVNLTHPVLERNTRYRSSKDLCSWMGADWGVPLEASASTICVPSPETPNTPMI